MTAAYRIKFTDTLTDQARDEFALSGVSADLRIGAAGSLTGTIPIARGDSAFGARIANLKSCAGSAVYVYRNGSPWWDGLLWTKTIASDATGKPKVAIQAGTTESYLDRVELATDLAPMLGADQLDIARSFITDMQSDFYSNLRIVPDALMSGTMRDRVAYLASASPTYLKMLTDLANLSGGFEFLFRTTIDGLGARTRRMVLGFPTITSPTVHRISKPGAILTYSLPEDGSRSATYLKATGSGVQSTVHVDTAALAAGYPRLNKTTSYSSITDAYVLEAHAAADLALAKTPVMVPTVTVRLEGTDITPYCLGDQVKVSIQDEDHPTGFSGTYRLVGMTISPNERGKPETCALTLN